MQGDARGPSVSAVVSECSRGRAQIWGRPSSLNLSLLQKHTQAEVGLFCGATASVAPSIGHRPVHGSDGGISGAVRQGKTAGMAAAHPVDSRVVTGPGQSRFFLHPLGSAYLLGTGWTGGEGAVTAADGGKAWKAAGPHSPKWAHSHQTMHC